MVTAGDVGDVDLVTRVSPGGDKGVVSEAGAGAVIIMACHHTVHLVVTQNTGQHRACVTTERGT